MHIGVKLNIPILPRLPLYEMCKNDYDLADIYVPNYNIIGQRTNWCDL